MPTEEEVRENGLYYNCLSEREKAVYKLARNCEGLLEEMALLRAKLHYIQIAYPTNVSLLLRAVSLLERLQKTHFTVFVKDRMAPICTPARNDPGVSESADDLMEALLRAPLGAT